MFFKHGIALSLIVAGFAVFVTSCAFHEKPPESTQFNVSNSELSCMDHISDLTDSYFNGQASVSDVNQVWDCSSKALTVFTKRVKGANPNYYRAVELRGFLQRYYVHKISLTDALMGTTGEFKQLLVGGKKDQISAADIKKVQQIFETMRTITLSLRTYFPISSTGFKGKLWKDLSISEIDAFSRDLSAAADLLGNVFHSAGVPYSFDQLSSFMTAIRDSLPTDDSTDDDLRSRLSSIQTHLALMEQAKSVLISPNAELISDGKDWKHLWSTVSQFASVAVKAAWLINTDRLNQSKDPHFPDETLTSGQNLVQVHALYGQLYGLLKSSISLRSKIAQVSITDPRAAIPFSEIEKLIQLVPADSLPASADILTTLIEPRLSGGSSALKRFVGGSDFGSDGRNAQGITLVFLNHADAWVQNWYEGQRFLQELFTRIGNAQSDLGGDFLSTTLFESPAAISLWKEVYSQSSPQWNANTILAARRIELSIRNIRPLYALSHSSEITFPVDNSREAFSFHDLSQKNWMQVAASMMIQGYVEYDPSELQGVNDGSLPSLSLPPKPPARGQVDSSPGVSFAEFKNFFQDLFPFGVAVKLFDPDDKKSSTNRFREIDSFTYSSNGDGYMSMDEAITYLGFSFSAFTKAARIHADLSSLCPIKPHADKYGENLIETECYRKYFFENAQTYWDPMATSAKFYQRLSPSEKARYEYLLEVAARKVGHNDNLWMDSGDSQGFVAALQYIEGIYSRYDVEKTGFLDNDAADLAFPVMKRALVMMAASETPPTQLSDTTADLVFNYMLDKGKVPDTACHKDKTYLGLITWYVQEHLPVIGHFEADRSKIMEIFGALGSGNVGLCGKSSPLPLPSSSPLPSPSS